MWDSLACDHVNYVMIKILQISCLKKHMYDVNKTRVQICVEYRSFLSYAKHGKIITGIWCLIIITCSYIVPQSLMLNHAFGSCLKSFHRFIPVQSLFLCCVYFDLETWEGAFVPSFWLGTTGLQRHIPMWKVCFDMNTTTCTDRTGWYA